MTDQTTEAADDPSNGEATGAYVSAQDPSNGEATGADRARQLFRYLNGTEWQEYRAILGIFAGTFFAEFSPDDVIARLNEPQADSTGTLPVRVVVDPESVPDRLESLKTWGNLTVSSSIGDPSSLADYYRRRHRYLITREGQEVFEITEGVLTRVDEVRDVQSGRLRDLHRALLRLIDLAGDGDATGSGGRTGNGLAGVDPDDIVDAVRAVFDPHVAFTTEVTQFFAAINQWQSRYDLEADQLRFFAEVLVGYVSEQLADIERSARPIARALVQLAPSLDQIVALANQGLAARVDEVGLADQITVRGTPGSRRPDWDHLGEWFSPRGRRRSRIDSLTGQAVAAVRTLTVNLTRLSGVGLGSTSRRADFVDLARFFAEAETVDDAHDLAAAAFGLGSARHHGVLPTDADDPVTSNTSWTDPRGPRASVPVSMRERGEVTLRGRASPVRDRSAERELLRRKRERTAEAERRTAAELLAAGGEDGIINDVELTEAAFVRLRDLVGRSSHRRRTGDPEREAVDAGLCCRARRAPGVTTSISSPEGRLRLIDLEIRIGAAGAAGAAEVGVVGPADAAVPIGETAANGPADFDDSTDDSTDDSGAAFISGVAR